MMKPIPPLSLLSQRALAASAAVLMTACASYQTITPKNQPIEHVTLSAQNAVANSKDAWPQDQWWLSLGDPQLNNLMQQALANNPSLANAQARIARAQASTALVRAGNGLQVNGAANASYGLQSENYLFPKPPLGPGGEYVSMGDATVNFSYDLDFWGRNSALIRSADAQLKAAQYDQQAARLALTTSIARSYSQLATQYELQAVLLATQKQRQSILKLIDQRVKNGLDTQVEVKTAQTNEASIKVELEQLSTAMKVTRLQLAALTGQMPSAAETITKPSLNAATFTIPQNLPLDLLGRRPELAAQRARIVAAYGEVEAAKAEFYPNINLNGLIGFQSIGLGQLLSMGSLTNSIGGALRLPIFDSGRLRANYAAKSADIDAVISQYNQSVLTAAQDVAEQLTRIADLAREDAASREALAAAEEAHRLTLLRYRAGLTPYLNVLTVETQLLAQRREMTSVQSRRHDLQIELIRALGGGFNEASAQPNAAIAAKSSTTQQH